MSAWQIWILIALVFFIIEIATTGFAIICFSIGAIIAAIAAIAGCGITFQIIWFSIGSFVAFITVRPILLRYFHNKKCEVPTNTDALIGRTAIVSEDIDPSTNKGRVAIDGDDWKAVSDDGQPIPTGHKVTITAINSIILTVKKQ